MKVKAINIVKSAMRLVNALGAGQTPSGEDQEDALQILNELFDEWSLERWMQSIRKEETFNLVPGVGIYPLGITTVPPPNTISIAKPIRIEIASILQGSASTELKFLNEADYAAYTDKVTPGTPGAFAYRSGTADTGLLYILPIPVNILPLTIWSWIPFTGFATVQSEIDVAPGVKKLLKYALAVEMAPEWTGKDASATIQIKADDLKANVKRINTLAIKYPFDAVGNLYPRRSSFNVMTGKG